MEEKKCGGRWSLVAGDRTAKKTIGTSSVENPTTSPKQHAKPFYPANAVTISRSGRADPTARLSGIRPARRAGASNNEQK
jgi:hypothetical protein